MKANTMELTMDQMTLILGTVVCLPTNFHTRPTKLFTTVLNAKIILYFILQEVIPFGEWLSELSWVEDVEVIREAVCLSPLSFYSNFSLKRKE